MRVHLKILGAAFVAIILVGSLTYVVRARWAPPELLTIKQNEWLACSADSDCIVVESACPGFYWSVNAQHAADNTAQNDRLRTIIDCGPPPANTRPLQPHCQHGQCQMPRQP